jgi:hypothetical protein
MFTTTSRMVSTRISELILVFEDLSSLLLMTLCLLRASFGVDGDQLSRPTTFPYSSFITDI